MGGGIHVLNGPWIIDTGKSPQDVLAALTTSLQEEDRGDRLLVLPIRENGRRMAATD